MKTKEQIQAVVNEILEVCERHGIVLIGGCESEGLYGEISIEDASQQPEIKLSILQRAINNSNILGNEIDGFSVGGIGKFRLT